MDLIRFCYLEISLLNCLIKKIHTGMEFIWNIKCTTIYNVWQAMLKQTLKSNPSQTLKWTWWWRRHGLNWQLQLTECLHVSPVGSFKDILVFIFEQAQNKSSEWSQKCQCQRVYLQFANIIHTRTSEAEAVRSERKKVLCSFLSYNKGIVPG